MVERVHLRAADVGRNHGDRLTTNQSNWRGRRSPFSGISPLPAAAAAAMAGMSPLLLAASLLLAAVSANPAEEPLAGSPGGREAEQESGRIVLEELEKSGLQLEEAGAEQHQESYSTFAAEFFETRYWGDEGYAFPSPPPVDPFAKIRVDDCGKTKGCFRYGKPGCDAETCDYFLSYRRIGADVEFELSADTDGWVAVGFSSDKLMGGDDVMACVHDDNGRVRIQHFYNVGQWAKEIKRNPARDEEGIFENNRVTCRFKRPVYVPRDETIIDLHLSWYYLFAWGPAIQGQALMDDMYQNKLLQHKCWRADFTPSAASPSGRGFNTG
ncbi:DOMON domain-containing protein FRRS1L isoform X2 [Scyliorhinus torazame]|uniref:DOMON domain-containing protein FRRS1L isoform X2 n=1 Tax=Scyliorhinus torazame TaxID=75743 RepID=UPI003B5B2289